MKCTIIWVQSHLVAQPETDVETHGCASPSEERTDFFQTLFIKID